MIKKRLPVIILAAFSAIYVALAELAHLTNLVFFIIGWIRNSDYFSYSDSVTVIHQLFRVFLPICVLLLVLALALACVKWRHLSFVLAPIWLFIPLYHGVYYNIISYNYYPLSFIPTINLILFILLVPLAFLCFIASLAAAILANPFKKEKPVLAEGKKSLKAEEAKPEEEAVEPAPEEPVHEPGTVSLEKK